MILMRHSLALARARPSQRDSKPTAGAALQRGSAVFVVSALWRSAFFPASAPGEGLRGNHAHPTVHALGRQRVGNG